MKRLQKQGSGKGSEIAMWTAWAIHISTVKITLPRRSFSLPALEFHCRKLAADLSRQYLILMSCGSCGPVAVDDGASYLLLGVTGVSIIPCF